jgi:ectoine hydroxylase-related dioxygenase (phytanoyl-CoA dioxygenase family)
MHVATNQQTTFRLREFRENGVVVAIGALRSARADISQGWEALKSGLAEGSIVRNARFVTGRLPMGIDLLWKHPVLVDAAQAVLGTENIALYMNRILLKDKDWNGAVSAHQDMPYFHGGLNKMSVFVPLSSTKARGGNGGLIFIKGSHLFGNLERGTIKRELFPSMEDIAPDLDVGDAIFMDFLTWHYSDDAPVPSERPLLQIVYQPSSDGSYAGPDLGVANPTLVSGVWQTSRFTARGQSTKPDG